MQVLPESELNRKLLPQPPKVTWDEFRRCRNDVLRALSKFGTVGPTGAQDHRDKEVAPFGVSSPDFFVVDDMYNKETRLHLIETDINQITDPLLHALNLALEQNLNWGAHAAIGDASIYVFAGQLIPCGRRFWDCDSIAAIVQKTLGPVDFGPVPVSWPTGYELWRDLICGIWNPTKISPAPDRQWSYILNHLMQASHVSKFTYKNRLIYDLHPATRHAFILRFLEELGSSNSALMVGLNSIAFDAGDLFARLESEPRWELLDHLAKAQPKLTRSEIPFFWAGVIQGLSNGRNLVEPASIPLKQFLKAQIKQPKAGLLELSALLGLAILKDLEVPVLASQLSSLNPGWEFAIHAWLQNLSNDPKAYPYPIHEIDWGKLD